MVGFEEQCCDLVNKHQDIAYAMVVAPGGKILFHNDILRHNQVITDPLLLTAIKSQKDVVQMCSMEKDKHYDFIIPVFGLHNEHLAAVRIGFPIILITQKTKMMIAYSIGFSIIFLAAGITLSLIMLNRWVSKPLFQLISVIQSIGKKGAESSALVEIDSKDEVGQLAAEFNQMVLQIRDYNKKIELYSRNLEEQVKERTDALNKANEQLKRDILKREQAERKLFRAYDDLKAAQAQLIQSTKLASIGELSAGVAHELNQPLMVIRGKCCGQVKTDTLY